MILNPQARKIQGRGGLMPEQAKLNRQISNNKKLEQIHKMSDKELVDQLKSKGLESFGTKQEKIDRLKKYHGIKVDLDWKKKAEVKSSCVKEVETLRKKREERRDNNNQKRHEILQLKAFNESLGRYGDVEYELMINADRLDPADTESHNEQKKDDIDIIIRKRPIFEKELVVDDMTQRSGENDVVSCANPWLCIHECKFKVDGVSKTVETHKFVYDQVFDENDSNEVVYSLTEESRAHSLVVCLIVCLVSRTN